MPETNLKQMLESKEFVVTCEVSPPHGSDASAFLERVGLVKDYCDAVNITDNVRGISNMSSMACAHLALEAGAEPVMQMTMRDRNRIIFESDLYGAHALGIRNLLFIRGDLPPKDMQLPAKMVFEMNSIQALLLAKHLESGFDFSGSELEGSPSFFLGATFNPFADPMNEHIARVEKKSEAGAEFFQTQAIYDVDHFERFMEQISGLNARVIAGVIPLRNLEMAHYINDEVSEIQVPIEFIKRIEAAGEGKDEEERELAMQKEGLGIAREIIEAVRKIEGVDGVHIMGVGWTESIPNLVREAGLFPRPRRE
ncbi:MAG: methylenetetrahydrofolate reductase [Candidatus Hodarchaeota archaeon]